MVKRHLNHIRVDITPSNSLIAVTRSTHELVLFSTNEVHLVVYLDEKRDDVRKQR